jgi:16S rRNA (cytosine967-C5)-methyltransferase
MKRFPPTGAKKKGPGRFAKRRALAAPSALAVAGDGAAAKSSPAAQRRTSARELALLVVRDVFGPDRRTAQAAFDVRARRTDLDARDRAFAAELAYGTIKHLRLLDWYLAPYLAGRAQKLPDAIGDVLRLGAYQILCMGGVEDHAAVFETVNLALRFGHRGTAGLVNAILRRLLADKPLAPDLSDFASDADFRATRSSLPTWVVAQWSARFPDAIDEIVAGVNAAPQYAVRANPLREGASEAVAATFASIEPSRFVRDVAIVSNATVGEDDASGRWLTQNESAAMPVDLLDVRPGERVVEFASGRGNKSAQIAGALGDEGSLVCVEIDARKVKIWRALMERCAITCATVVEGDARSADLPRAQRVLVDAPCSGLGTLGRHPEARWRKDPADGERLQPLQRAMLARAGELVEAGGRLVYSVCSSDPREAEDVVEPFLAANPDFERAALPERYAEFERGGDVVVPPGIAGRDGFYIAVLNRRV